MPGLLLLRPLTDAEAHDLRRWAHARTAPARTVERAQIVWRAQQGARVPAIARALGRSQATVRLWLTRFNAQGIAGLTDAPRRAAADRYARGDRDRDRDEPDAAAGPQPALRELDPRPPRHLSA